MEWELSRERFQSWGRWRSQRRQITVNSNGPSRISSSCKGLELRKTFKKQELSMATVFITRGQRWSCSGSFFSVQTVMQPLLAPNLGSPYFLQSRWLPGGFRESLLTSRAPHSEFKIVVFNSTLSRLYLQFSLTAGILPFPLLEMDAEDWRVKEGCYGSWSKLGKIWHQFLVEKNIQPPTLAVKKKTKWGVKIVNSHAKSQGLVVV